jgi:murein DD-endopeptidase MepM/ murein hydrolase activator NlpD
MNIILVSPKTGRTWRLELDIHHLRGWLLLGGVFAAFAASFIYMGAWLSGRSSVLPGHLAQHWSSELRSQRAQLSVLQTQAESNSRQYAQRMAVLQAQITRVDAAASRMLQVAQLDAKQFGFGNLPPLGGPLVGTQASTQTDSTLAALDRFQSQLDQRERQLSVLEELLLTAQTQKQLEPSGWPVQGGYVSSHFGHRADPFTGASARHEGMDFAAPEGTPIYAAGLGIVSFVGERNGYGNVVEINHGNGYTTRYAHNSAMTVKVGDTVRRGEMVAKVGNNGRSTGPHLHFEVLLNGEPVNPASFVQPQAGAQAAG